MNSIGTKASQRIAGDWKPTSIATKPRTAARLYPGAVEATPMTTLERKPRAPVFSPLSPSLATPALGAGSAAEALSIPSPP